MKNLCKIQLKYFKIYGIKQKIKNKYIQINKLNTKYLNKLNAQQVFGNSPQKTHLYSNFFY